MEFIKWSSIENHYRTKELSRWTMRFPTLIEARYHVTEKLHGSCIVIAASPDGEIRYGSRNQWLDASDTFFGCFPRDIDALLPEWDHRRLVLDAAAAGGTIRLYGELIGPGIQKGVRYGDKKRILFFGLTIGGLLQSFSALATLTPWTVPLVGVVDGLQSALDFDTVFHSSLIPDPDNLCEGVVIAPVVPCQWDASYFLLKKKNEAFKERQRTKKEHVPDAVVDPLNEAFRSYITEARMQSVFSKEGPIESKKDIGRYIKLILADAKEDFEKDFPEAVTLDKKQQKGVYNVGSTIAQMLMAEM